MDINKKKEFTTLFNVFYKMYKNGVLDELNLEEFNVM